MSVSSTEHLDKLGFILYDRPSGRNIIGYAIEKIEQLREELSWTTSNHDNASLEIERLRAENEKLRAALKPFAALHLWPDDVGDHIASDIRSDEDWIEKENDDSKEDLFVRRGDIRIARNALEGGR